LTFIRIEAVSPSLLRQVVKRSKAKVCVVVV